MPQRLTFYLLVETSRHFTREILRGVIRWSNLYGPVTLIVSTDHVEQELPQLKKIENVGVIARLQSPGVIEAVKRLHIPVVTIEPCREEFVKIKNEFQISEMVSNASAIASMTLRHFTSRGFHNFAFCGLPQRIWSSKRQEAFVQKVEALSAQCHVYPVGDGPVLPREDECLKLAAWLKGIPKPVAVLACNDDRGTQLIQASALAGIPVPDQVAILGIDNDDLVCELTSPALSSIAFDLKRVGFEAANLLWQLTCQTVAGYHCIPVEPTHVVTRLSTDVMAQDDELVADAIRYIRGSFRYPIGVDDVARQLDVSRRTLERRFTSVLGRSVREQIELFRFEQARQLLLQTNNSVETIALLAGFQHFKPMLRVFLQNEGVSPNVYRKKMLTQ
ncbi:MAG: DNA-binding transcriptional regulator [Thermoguttaceae bacterium]|nr:DNA-binding transcriptional regulator [Thermoguttaceae bacterium]